MSKSQTIASGDETDSVFDSIGVLEHIFSFCDVPTLLCATLVSHRWKQAGRHDDLWLDALKRLWRGKRGMYFIGDGQQQQFDNTIFWRSLFSKELVEKMTEDQIRSFFGHPLLERKRLQLEQRLSSPDLSAPTDRAAMERKLYLQRFVSLHQLDTMSDLTSEEVQQSHYSMFGDNESDDDSDDEEYFHNNYDENASLISNRQRPRALPRRHFFSDLYFGSYACSVMDSHRNRITQLELCRPFGFILYFKVDAEEVLEDLSELPSDDEDEDGQEGILIGDPGDNDNRDDHHDENYAQSAARRGALEVYEHNQRILLYKHSICFFDSPDGTNDGPGLSLTSNGSTRTFRMEVLDHVEHGFQTDLAWRWITNGSKVQVGPYPPLCVKRRHDDWGFELENIHVIMRSLEADGKHPEPRRRLPAEFIAASEESANERLRRRHRRRRQNLEGARNGEIGEDL